MRLFKKILYPTDFSEDSIRSMSIALELAQMNNSELIILYSYRLNGASDNFHAKISFKSDTEKKAGELFNKVDEEVLSRSGIDYKLLSEVGFVGDRIASNVDTQNIDLVVLCKEIQEQLQATEGMKNGLITAETSCPVLLLPQSIIQH